MADAAVTFLLENVSQLLKSYADLISGAETELQQLKNELGLLKSFLQEAAKNPKKEEPFREMERQIKEVVYDAEDTIDSCLTQAAAAKAKKFIRRGLKPNRVSLAKEVKSLREDKVKPMVDKTKMVFPNMKIGEGSSKNVEEQWTTVKKAQLIRQDYIVGFEDEEKTLINYLMEPKDKVDVISIVGMPGLGKTTLAWKIYQNKKIQYEFPTRIWAYISQEFNQKDVFLNIVKSFTNRDMSSLSDDDLVQTVQHYLKEQKFLLVMDDVWSVDAWNAIQHVLPENNKMGKVLITSHDSNVGKHVNVTRDPHMLRFLNNEESWKLLQLEVFGKLDDCPQELKDIGKYIAKQCGGLPLAVVVIGGILVEQLSIPVNNATINAWNKVSENASIYVTKDREHRISDIVAFSYNKLPNDLRDCFLYLAVFPEDYEIPAWTLTCLWIAEGFVQHKEGQSLEETAETNLKDLIDRNLVMVEKTNPYGEVKTCRVHDVIHAFCNYKAAEKNLVREIKMSKEGVFDPPLSDIQKYRRLCIHSCPSKFLSKKLKVPSIRSFLCFNKDPMYYLEAKYISAIPDAFSLLRVLDSKSFKFTQFPMKVTKLCHLRYVTLCCDGLDVLPEAISDLWNLQTLVVDTKSHSLKIKANIWRMIQLRHLKTKAAIILAIQGEGGAGENLQTVSRLSPEYCTEDMFDRACNLKRLGIQGQLATLLDAESMRKLNHLEKLKLVHDLVCKPASENRLAGLPRPNCFPPNLRRLTLSATFLDWRHMSILGKIETLQVLKLKDYAFSGKFWNVVGYGFRSLQFLLIANTDLVFWEASADDFPGLKCLVLKNCEKLSKIPFGLAKTLQALDIERIAQSAVESAREIENEKKRMQGQEKARWGRFKLTIGPGCQ